MIMGRLLDNLDTVLDDDFFEQLIQLPIDKHDNSLTLNEILGMQTHEQYIQDILVKSYLNKKIPYQNKYSKQILYQNECNKEILYWSKCREISSKSSLKNKNIVMDFFKESVDNIYSFLKYLKQG